VQPHLNSEGNLTPTVDMPCFPCAFRCLVAAGCARCARHSQPTNGLFPEPQSSSTLEEPEDEVEDASADSCQKISLSTPQICGEPALLAQTTTTRSPSIFLSRTTPGLYEVPRQSGSQHHDPPKQPKQLIPAVSPPIQLYSWTSWDDLLYGFDAA
jgi:hypothetical protein